MGKDERFYLISMVCKLLNVHPQTLRLYEREGFIKPKRIKKQRIYTDEDLERLNFVIKLTKEFGVNRAGVDIILRMRERMQIMEEVMQEMLRYVDEEIRQQVEKRIKKFFEQF
ncbi:MULTISPECIES: MerR family transcriptional regulator [Thermodesulfovibrio]|jgi:MerR family transcriptional regulator/heat shock protein HspR|uniref:Transcriptional regulator n=2 Tax=Thermodesulfovibrio yellowstonii TaxID=28262 RepID=B5YI88_THEYD|nr:MULTISPECIES: MerR family transcriptional regulator [Thermodesulfovibrio]ACI20355.1 transcriptional regulator [Thermodesulfovibrio yellowstonii DSM 11347]MDI6864556.1 MerR family transcriptional regulator [Thermodesulfovibrio yellowstonii]GLI52716.1 transcriptional regulator [Thermodesulfovibrio islandicus]